MKTNSLTTVLLCFITLLAFSRAQIPPTNPPPVNLPPNFRCPRNLIFAFECKCYFNRIGVLEIFPQEEFTCNQRAASVEANPSLGYKIARQCQRYYSHLEEITGPAIRGVQDLIFNECSDALDELCPTDPDYRILECTCFLLQTGKVPTSDPTDIDDCNADWGEITRENRRVRRRRCRQNIKFKDFIGALLGISGRQCFFGGHTNCCNALLGPPSQ